VLAAVPADGLRLAGTAHCRAGPVVHWWTGLAGGRHPLQRRGNGCP